MIPVDEMSSSSAARLGPSPRAWLRLLGAWSLAVGLLIAAAWPVIATVTPETFTAVIDLSKRAKTQIKSAYPDIEASADGRYVATVWSRGYDNEDDTKHYGYIFLKSALTRTNEATDGWENQVKVYTPTDTIWGADPRADFDPRDSGKLYVTWRQCENKLATCDKILVTTCTLTGTDKCAAPETVYPESHASPSLTTPDIAADKSGRLHVTWKNETLGSGAVQGIQYASKSGGSWAAPDKVVGTDLNSYNPALVWASGPSGNGRLHLAWFQFSGSADSRFIQYNADTDPGNPTWTPGTIFSWEAPALYILPGSSGEPFVKPSIAASGTNVYIAWDVYKSGTTPSKFHLVYDCSTNSGAAWQNSSSTGLALPGPTFTDTTTYRSPLGSIDEEDALRPSVAISGQSPAIAWHFEGDQHDTGIMAYLIAYRGSAGSCGGLAWDERIAITQNIDYDPSTPGSVYDDAANPDLAMAPGSGVHIAFMGMWGNNRTNPASDWDIYYRGDIKADNSTDDVSGIYLPLIMKN